MEDQANCQPYNDNTKNQANDSYYGNEKSKKLNKSRHINKQYKSIWSPTADGMVKISKGRDQKNSLEMMKRLFVSSTSANMFLELSDSLGVAAIKGLGKTFLLVLKRCKLEKDFICLPKGQTYLDHCEPIHINAELGKLFSEKEENIKQVCENWTSAWSIAIVLSIIKNLSAEFHIACTWDHIPVVKNLLRVNPTAPHKPSEFLAEMLSYKINDYKSIIDSAAEIMAVLTNCIQSGIAIFIDSADHAPITFCNALYCDNKQKEFLQAGLMLAAQRLARKCSHVKVFYSIKLDVLQKISLYNTHADHPACQVVSLTYNKEEIKKMFSTYIKNENDQFLKDPSQKNKDPAIALIGTNKLKNKTNNCEESLFDYIYRHTFRRPRDLMYICEKIATEQENNERMDIYTIISSAVDELLLQYITGLLGENYNVDDKEFDFPKDCFEQIFSKEFLMMIPCDIITPELLKLICSRFSKTNIENCNYNNCYDCTTAAHLFDKLYGLGLLGIIVKSREEDSYHEEHISLTKLTEINNEKRFALLKQDHVLFTIHSAVAKKIIRLSSNSNFTYIKHFMVNSGKELSMDDYNRIKSEIDIIYQDYKKNYNL